MPVSYVQGQLQTPAKDNNPAIGVSKVHPLTGSGNLQPPSGSGSSGSHPDVYTWDPRGVGTGTGVGSGSMNNLASDFHNWLKNGAPQRTTGTIPGNKSTDEAKFDGSISNAPIIWNHGFTFSTMLTGGFGGYTAIETLDPNVSIELTGVDGSSGAETANSALTIKLGKDGVIKEDKDIEWTNFYVTSSTPGDLTPQWIVNSGTTTIARPGGYTEKLGVNLIINQGGILDYRSNNSLTLTQSNITITVKGEMDVYWGTGSGITLIQGPNQVTGCYIHVTAGKLKCPI
jgi:hypothetical protein